jgi:streptomycin 6-kinase
VPVAVDVPERVAHIARLTSPGRRWLADLPATLAVLEATWDVRIAAALGGGTASYVAAAVTASGTETVVKVMLPPEIEGHASSYDAEVTVLRHGGNGYVRLLASDVACRALLLERLGPPLRDLGWPIRRQLTAIATTLRSAWAPAPSGAALDTLESKGRWFVEFLDRTWHEAGQPCSRRTVEIAQAYAAERAASQDPSRAMLLHGDGHASNTLAAPEGGFRLVDPDGVVGEHEYDLAIAIREVLAPDLAPDARRVARELCRLVADTAGGDPDVVWQWAFVERASTGLLSARLGLVEPARLLLAVIDDWAVGPP